MGASQILAIVAEGNIEASVLAHFRFKHYFIRNFARLGSQTCPFWQAD